MTVKTEKHGSRRMERPDDLLAGRCFFIVDEHGDWQYQGVIWGRVEPGFYLIQYFECFMGQPNDMKVVPLSEIMQWRLEEDDEMLRFQTEHGHFAGRERRQRKQKAA
jgi:hypothetical protein